MQDEVDGLADSHQVRVAQSSGPACYSMHTKVNEFDLRLAG